MLDKERDWRHGRGRTSGEVSRAHCGVSPRQVMSGSPGASVGSVQTVCVNAGLEASMVILRGYLVDTFDAA